MEQGDFLADFPLQRWIFLNKTFKRHRIGQYIESVSLLYILAEENLAELIRVHPQRRSCFEIENERYGLPIFAALASKSHEAVQTFLEVQAEIQLQEPLLHHLYKQHFKNRNKRTNFGRNFTFSWQRSISSYLAEQSDEVFLTFLCASGNLDVESKDKLGRTPLSWLAQRGHNVALELLLERGAELETKDYVYSRTPLSWATQRGHEAVVKLLLENGAELETKNNHGQTLLSWAVMYGHEAIVQLLLRKGAKKPH
jgi:hypothetical protein